MCPKHTHKRINPHFLQVEASNSGVPLPEFVAVDLWLSVVVVEVNLVREFIQKYITLKPPSITCHSTSTLIVVVVVNDVV